MQLGPLKLKAQLYCGDQIAIGPGKADLLEAIEREGSISRAGQAMGMSYRRTWLLVDQMNRCWCDKLVEAVPGGASNRGARITDRGREVLHLYRAIERDLIAAADAEALGRLAALLRAKPLAAQDHSDLPQAERGSA